jgi:hypothetical protein
MEIIKFQFPPMILDYVLFCVIAEKGKQKPKMKRAKQFNILKPPVKKMEGQTANKEGSDISEATDISKGRNNNIQENNSAKNTDENILSSSLYTQELSSKETEHLNEKSSTDARSKPIQFESMNDIGRNDTPRQDQDASSPTKSENVSIPKCKQPSTNNERQARTDKMQMLPDDENETQFTFASNQDENVINCSQDFFSSQFGTNEQSMSQKKKGDAGSGSTDVQALNKISISGEDTCGNTNAFCKRNETCKITVDNCMDTLGETSEIEQIKTTNSLIRGMEEDTDKMLCSGGALTGNNTCMTESNTSIQSVLQPDVDNPSASIAPTGSHSDCSDKVPLVPHSQFKTLCNKPGQLDDKNCDAVVPELNSEDFDNNSYDSIDFEPEE